MKRPHHYILVILTVLLCQSFIKNVSAQESSASQWEGVWFTCEPAQRQRAPDDKCQMFDNEGFEYNDGQLYYLEMIGSDETACRGNKKGHCFKANMPAITVKKKEIVRYWGCEQGYYMTQGADYMTIKPDGKNCLWSRERHFYIAPYEGAVSIK